MQDTQRCVFCCAFDPFIDPTIRWRCCCCYYCCIALLSFLSPSLSLSLLLPLSSLPFPLCPLLFLSFDLPSNKRARSHSHIPHTAQLAEASAATYLQSLLLLLIPPSLTLSLSHSLSLYTLPAILIPPYLFMLYLLFSPAKETYYSPALKRKARSRSPSYTGEAR